jgi:D-arabinose 1-dehydrogenase-like Zn-dependent alcohol dehydrogenase
MRAVRFHEYGGVETLVVEQAPHPQPGPGEIRIRVAAASVNAYRADLAQTLDADADIVALIIEGRRNRVTRLTKRLPLLGAS